MAAPAYLVDNSVLARMSKAPIAARMEPLILGGEVATCSVTDLEQLFSARSAREHCEWREEIALRFRQVAVDQRVLDRAVEVQALLANRGEHRAASIPDLIVAAAAERAELAVLHYDSDFETIAGVTGQATEWVVERGAID